MFSSSLFCFLVPYVSSSAHSILPSTSLLSHALHLISPPPPPFPLIPLRSFSSQSSSLFQTLLSGCHLLDFLPPCFIFFPLGSVEREGPGHQTCTWRLWGNAATVFARVILIQLESNCRRCRDAADQRVTIMSNRGAHEEECWMAGGDTFSVQKANPVTIMIIMTMT